MIRRISEAIRSLRAKEILRAIKCFQNKVNACIAKWCSLWIFIRLTEHTLIHSRRRLIWIEHSKRERQGDSREWSAPNVRGEGLTWIKYLNEMKFSSHPHRSSWVMLSTRKCSQSGPDWSNIISPVDKQEQSTCNFNSPFSSPYTYVCTYAHTHTKLNLTK